MPRSLQNMVVLITGASAGIGRSLAVALDAAGCRLALCARREDRLNELNASLGGRHLVIRADVGVPDDCRRAVAETVKRFGRVDTLVCNAGYGIYKRVDETDVEEVRRMFNIDVVGTTECIRHSVPVMAKQDFRDGWRGQIMIVSSAAARCGIPFLGIYSGAKAAQLAIAEAMRIELRDQRIAVTTVHPTPTKTEFRQTAEQLGSYRLSPSDGFIKTQTAEQVAAKMVRAIARPRREVWPMASARWMLGLGILIPILRDRGLGKYYDVVVRFNREEPKV